MTIEEEIGENPDLQEVITAENELKKFVTQYVGEKLAPESGDVTVEMIVEVFSTEFPEFLLAVAEENWIRGYHQAFMDIEKGEEIVREEEKKQKNGA